MSIFSLLGKKRLKEQHVARVFVNTVNELAETAFPSVAEFLNEAPELETCPNIKKDQIEWFLYTVFSANLFNLKFYFEAEQLNRMRILVIDEFITTIQDRDQDIVLEHINIYEDYLKGLDRQFGDLNKAMAVAIFNKYNLSKCQVDHFQKINSPNPIIVKSIEEITNNFIWNWNDFFEKYRMTA